MAASFSITKVQLVTIPVSEDHPTRRATTQNRHCDRRALDVGALIARAPQRGRRPRTALLRPGCVRSHS
jgi:hypothetical protein